MRKKLCTVMAAVMVAGAAMTACSSQPAETTAAETAAESTTEETAESTSEEASGETAESSEEAAAETENAADDEISEEELTELYRAFGESLQAVIGAKSMDELAVLLGYPCYIGIDDGVTVENEEQFLALDADKVFTDELVAAVENADLSSIEASEAGFVIGDPSGKPNVTIGLDANNAIGITGINY